MIYVTYDETGALTGYYNQDLHPDHVVCHIEVAEPLVNHWTSYQANAARNGLEDAPPYVPPVVVPASITRRQARQKLLLAGLLDSVEPMIEAIPDATARALALIEWQDSQVFERHRPLVISIGSALGLDSAELDTLFIEASAL